MSHSRSLFDYDNSEDDNMATNYSDYHYDYRDNFYEGCDDIEDRDDHYDDSMDGDFDSGMRDAGFGTDEDYGYYGGEDY